MTIFAQFVTCVFVLTCITHQCTHCQSDLLEVRLRISWICCAVCLAYCTRTQTSSRTQTAPGMTLGAFLGRGVGVKSVGTHSQTTAVTVQEKEVGSA